MNDFFHDLDTIIGYESEGPVKTFAFKRLTYLESLFEMHLTLNEVEEQAICKVGFFLFSFESLVILEYGVSCSSVYPTEIFTTCER